MEENYKLSKWLNDEMTAEELSEFQADKDFAIFEKIKKYSSELETPAFDEQKMLSKIVTSAKKEVKIIPLFKNWMVRVAAILLIGMGLLFTFRNVASSTELADNGVQNTFSLPDNSEVVLNSGSEIQYKKWNWDNNRSLNLEGEAFFKVAKGKKFEVNTPQGKVTVLGTQFNVKQRGNYFDVSCYEGKVKVNFGNNEFILTKGMSVAVRDGKTIPIPPKNTLKPEWLEQEMVFYQESLPSIVAEFERHFNIELELNTTGNGQLFTGTIPAKNSDTALQILCTTYHLKPTKVTKTKIILENN
ncbi:MAG: FecR family protein [Flavobacterium sp.]|jgi:ferric-dicitrate binding protein FerR (iron transport regulator)|uniref:FecR family protein n=1 Tax=Flavobacterium sp. TaxID=239 RepID=UPI0022C51F99|nr:FecR family protein [Flavobacterium sp.]MCZ8331743.1 FecR family protein [Flavobacterium sp.]